MRRVIFVLIICLCTTYVHAQLQSNWKNSGPVAFPLNKSGQINGIARCSQLKFHPTDSNKRYTASASGGLYYTHNGGKTWQPMNTDKLPKTSCASVAIHPVNDSIIYLGTGDANYYSGGMGVWKTTNMGATWFSANTGMGNVLVIEILIDPANPDVLIAATDNGIYKSTNAAATWTQKSSVTGFKDMIFKASPLTDTIYAVNSSEFYISPNKGETWTKVTNGVVIPGGGSGGGFRLGVSAANPDVVYIGMIKDEGTILKSTNGGTSFSTVYHNPAVSLTGYDPNTPGQGNYNFDITCDPNNAQVVYLVSHCVWRSDDGGITWTRYTVWSLDCHTDMHHIVHNPYNPAEIYNVNDGAIFVSVDSGDTWADQSDGIAATEVYHAAQSPISQYYNSIGTQDNGELYLDATGWKTNRGGDWGERMSFCYAQPNQVYYHSGNRRIVSASDQSWNIPFTPGNNGNDVELAFTPANTSVGYCAKTDLWVSNNLSNTNPVWTKVTALSKSVKALQVSENDAGDVFFLVNTLQLVHVRNANTPAPVVTVKSVPYSTTISNIALVKNHPNEIFISCGNRVYFSNDTGNTWTNVSYNLPVLNIKRIFHDNFSNDHAIYACNAAGVYFRNDTMNYWANYSGALPTIATYADFMMYNDGTPLSKIMASYYGRGVWESQMFKPNALPAAEFGAFKKAVCINELAQFYDSSTTNTTSYYWTFTGGNPATSTLKNPVTTYPVSGKYDVTLVAINAFGSDTLTKTAYIKVIGDGVVPFSENFEGSFPPPDWDATDVNGNNGKWYKKTGTSAYGVGQACAYFNNFNYDEKGTYDRLITKSVDLTGAIFGLLQFDVAYADRGSPANSDTLAVYVSADCGTTYNLIYVKGGTGLATAPPLPNSTFVPSAVQWRTDSIDLTGYIGQKLLFAFENRGYHGQALYLDNVNINVFTGMNENADNTFTIWPNPNRGAFVVTFEKSNLYSNIGIQTMEGKAVYTAKIDPALKQISLDLSSYPQGVYTFQLNGDGVRSNGKLVMVK